MRTLKFKAESVEYRLLHQGSIQSGGWPNMTSRDHELVAKVQTRLESLGTPLREPTEKDSPLSVYPYYNEHNITVVFEEEEFQMLRKLFNTTGFGPAGSRFVTAVNAFLDAAKEEIPKPQLVK